MQHLRFALNLAGCVSLACLFNSLCSLDDFCAHVRCRAWERKRVREGENFGKSALKLFRAFLLKRSPPHFYGLHRVAVQSSNPRMHYISVECVCSSAASLVSSATIATAAAPFFHTVILFRLKLTVCVYVCYSPNVSVIRIFYSNFLFHFQFRCFFPFFSSIPFAECLTHFFSISILSVVPFTMPELFGVYTMDYLLLALPTIPNVFSCTATVPHSDSPFSQLWWLPPFQVCMLQFYISHSACLLFFSLRVLYVTWNSHGDNFRCDARQQ